jgi:hypothetical protein
MTTTIVSAYATNAAQALSSFQAISATYSSPTPAAATTALASTPSSSAGSSTAHPHQHCHDQAVLPVHPAAPQQAL